MPKQIDFKAERIHRLEGKGSIKAFADVSINDELVIKGVRVIEGRKGLFVSMPQEQGKDKRWYDTVRCITTESRAALTDAVMAAYKEGA